MGRWVTYSRGTRLSKANLGNWYRWVRHSNTIFSSTLQPNKSWWPGFSFPYYPQSWMFPNISQLWHRPVKLYRLAFSTFSVLISQNAINMVFKNDPKTWHATYVQKGESICLSQSDPGLHLLQSSYFQNQILFERWKECSMFVPTFQSAQEAHTISVAQYNPQWFLYFALTGGASYYQNADSRPMIIPGEFENVISGYHSNLHMWQVICASFEEA